MWVLNVLGVIAIAFIAVLLIVVMIAIILCIADPDHMRYMLSRFRDTLDDFKKWRKPGEEEGG